MDHSVKSDTLDWIKLQLIPKVNEITGFSSTRLIWVKTDGMVEGITYAIQFETETYAVVEDFHKKSDLINQWISQKFGDKVLPFATELHVIDNF